MAVCYYSPKLKEDAFFEDFFVERYYSEKVI